MLSYNEYHNYHLKLVGMFSLFFVFKQKTADDMRISDWSSDVCSSDLPGSCCRALPLLRSARRRFPSGAALASGPFCCSIRCEIGEIIAILLCSSRKYH